MSTENDADREDDLDPAEETDPEDEQETETEDPPPEEEADEEVEPPEDGDPEEPEAPDEPEEPGADAPLTITLGEPEVPPLPQEPSKAQKAFAALQKEKRELARKNAELEQRIAAQNPVKPQGLPELGPEPKLSDPDVMYDGEALKAKVRAHDAVKKAHDDAKAKAKAEEQRQADDWKAKVEGHTKKIGALKVPDYEDASEVVEKTLDPVQRAIIVGAAKDSAQVIYALGKHPKRAAALGAIKDPVKFAAEIGFFEAGITVDDRRSKSPPPPPRRVSGSGPVPGNSDKELERLEKLPSVIAGNRQPIIDYKRKKAEAEAKKKK